jgi:hypothetical protein
MKRPVYNLIYTLSTYKTILYPIVVHVCVVLAINRHHMHNQDCQKSITNLTTQIVSRILGSGTGIKCGISLLHED